MSARGHRRAAAGISLSAVALLCRFIPGGAWPRAQVAVVREQIDAWPLALNLGALGTAQVLYARLEAGSRTHYYLLSADPGQALEVCLSAPARPGVGARGLRLLLVGPGLPRGPTPSGVRPLPGDGVRWAAANGAPSRGSPPGYRVLQHLRVRVPARGRYVLVVYAAPRGEGVYRLALAGERRPGLGEAPALLRGAFAAEYLIWPERALARWALLATGLAAALGLWYLAGRGRSGAGMRPR